MTDGTEPEPAVSTGHLGKASTGRVIDARLAEATVVPAIVTLAAIIGSASPQGGYFPTSWGWIAVPLLLTVGVWLAFSGRTDAGRHEAVFLCALTLLVVWVGASIAWSIAGSQSVLEFERGFVPLAGCAAFVVLARREAGPVLYGVILLAITGVCLYALATRLDPAHLGVYDPASEYRLSEPIGYWNGLGIFAVMGALLAVGSFTDVAARTTARIAAAVAVVVLVVTIYFTYSRASWLVLAVGLAWIVVLSRSRRRLVLETAALAVLCAVTVLVASHSSALTHKNALVSDAVHQGRRLAAVMFAIALCSAALTVALVRLEKRVSGVSLTVRRLVDVSLVGIVLVLVAVPLVRFGGPVNIASRAYDSFVSATAPTEKADLNQRLFTLNGNGRVPLWKVALRDSRGHRLAGTGAGSFERLWERDATVDFKVRDAHGLYVETLAELGVVGLLLLVAALAVPLAIAFRFRSRRSVPALGAAYVAFLLHAAFDWDWELSGVTLTALVIGCLLLVNARRASERTLARLPRWLGVVGVAAAASFSFVGLVGNGSLASAQSALDRGDTAVAAARASSARRWMTWSPDPLLVQGEAELALGDIDAARGHFDRVIEMDPRNWRAWLDRAAATTGSERARSVRRARDLYPKSPEIRSFEKELAGSTR